MNDLRKSWEQRARSCGDNPAGVLLRGLSGAANACLHAWHAWLVENVLLPSVPCGGKLLDLGCGYGRLARRIRVERPDIAIYGTDLAFSYCSAFGSQGAAVQSDLAEGIPYRMASFDGVLAVTSLMYVTQERMPSVLRDLRRTLKPGAHALLIDPGAELLSLAGRMRLSRARSTGGAGFMRDEYLSHACDAGYEIVSSGGNPAFTWAMMLPWWRRSGDTESPCLARIARSDHREGGYGRWALHRWMLCANP